MPLRKTLTLLSLLSCWTALRAQTYEKDWAAIDSLSRKGLAQSATTLANAVYTRARAAHQDPEAIRSLMDLIRVQQPIVENADSLSIRLWESAADSFAGPARSVVLNLEAQAFSSYLARNRYQLENRQASTTPAGDDFTTWSIADYTHRIDSLFSAALSDTVVLGATKLDRFTPIIDPGNSRFLRPTLLDFLADRTIRYYSSEAQGTAADTLLFAPADIFMMQPFMGMDASRPLLKVVRLYQLLLRFHARDPYPDALVDADIARLRFIHGAYENGDSLYARALAVLTRRYAHQVAGAAASYALADYLAGKGASYDPSTSDPSYRWARRQALDTLDAIIRAFPGSLPAGEAVVLAREIRKPSLDMQTGSVCLPGHPFLASVSFTNVARLHLRIIRYIPDAGEKSLRAAKVLRGWTQPIPDPGDFQDHRTEIAVGALTPGYYILLAALNGKFGTDSLPLVATEFQVSSIGWLRAGARDAYILNRETGEPLAGARVRIPVKTGARELLTDKDGHISLEPVASDPNNGVIHIYDRDDSVTISGIDYPVRLRKSHPSATPQYTFITDRAIYRPGQTVYFKTIGTLNEGDTVKPIPTGTPVTVYLQRYSQKIDSLRLRMSDFSSANGDFRLPSSLPTGNYEISAGDRGRIYFSVEEYKRARFNVRFDAPGGDYRLGDTVTLKGNAQAYAGNAIDGARVSFTVIRLASPIFPGIMIRYRNRETVLHDTVRTDAAGDFPIRVPLVSGQGNSATFEVHADVTDRNGETHGADFTLEANQSALRLTILLPGSPVLADSLDFLAVIATNPAGVKRDVRARLTISRLAAPTTLTRERLWDDPDVFAIPEDSFHRVFPVDPYGKQTDKRDWPVQGKVLEDSLTTNTPFDLARLPSGVYRFEVSALDTFGQRADAKEVLVVFDPRSGEMPYPAYAWTCPGAYSTGDSVTYYIGSSAGPRFTVVQSSGDPRVLLNTFRIPGRVTELHFPAFRKGKSPTSVGAAFFAVNRSFTNKDAIRALPADDSLRLKYATFRDHLEPGATEHLTLSVRGPGGKAADAEVAASLYDASLDQFIRSPWSLPDLELSSGAAVTWNAVGFDASAGETMNNSYPYVADVPRQKYDELYDRSETTAIYGMRAMSAQVSHKIAIVSYTPPRIVDKFYGNVAEQDERKPADQPAEAPPIPDIRKNFNETAFFYPTLHTDKDGNVSYAFTMPDALTRWTLQTLAHTRNLRFGLDTRDLTTQKTLMLQPNVPRFLREGDDVWLSTKVVSMAHTPLQGTVRLELLDALTMKPSNIPGSTQSFSIGKSGAAEILRFHLDIPRGYIQPHVYRLTAVAGNYSDGEQGPIPILSRRILVTETYPLRFDGAAPQTIDIDPLIHAGPGTAYRLTLEYAASPAWYALMALPYLEPASDACPQAVLDRYYTDALGAGIVKAIPPARDAIARAAATPSEQSPLDKDPELKNNLLQETPWVLDAKDERTSIKELARYLDNTNSRSDELHALLKLQSQTGGFPWFTGSPDNRYATQYIVEHLGKLSALGMLSSSDRQILGAPLRKMLAWLDKALIKDAKDSVPGEEDLQYPYVRSFFKDVPAGQNTQHALDFYLALGKNHWMDYSLMAQAKVALACHRIGDDATAGLILTSIKQRSLFTPELGRYWKKEECWYWYQAPIETQSLLLEAFSEIANDTVTVDQLRTWLLGQKQTHAWAGNSATADACYALLLGGHDWLGATPSLAARVGEVTVNPGATAGYIKTQWEKPNPSMGHITLRRTGNTSHRSWGAIYYQHFQDLDSITAAQTTLALQKQLFVVPSTGNLLKPVRDGDTLHLGDRVRIRLVLRSDRPLDFVSLKDLRPACFEPVEALSGYRWQGGLGYYFSPGDLSTSFYLDHLPRGTFVLEYDQYVNMAGVFAGGVATLQSLYAPQFAARTAGLTLKVF